MTTPHPDPHRAYRRHTTRIVLLIAVLLLVSAGYAVEQLWQSWRLTTLDAMSHDAWHVSQQVDAAVLDATKMLDMARTEMEAATRHGPISPLQAQAVLLHTSSTVSLPGSVIKQGLLFVADRDGRLYARNCCGPLPTVLVKDRLYFRRLLADPTQRYSIGELTQGRVTHTTVFHLAEPLRDGSGRFAGVVLQQVPCAELAQALASSVGKPQGQIRVLLNARDLVFAYPLPTTPGDLNPDRVERLYAVVARDGREAMALAYRSNGNGLDPDGYLAYVRSPVTGLITTEQLTQRQMITGFAQNHLHFLGLTGLIAALVAVLMLLHIRQTRNLFDALDASLRDTLTGLPNRRALDQHFPLLWREALRLRAPTSALFIDIDHFKRFNDEHGHVCADRALQQVAQALARSLRRPFDFVCRWGGEEFVVLLPRTEAEGALQVAQTMLDEVRKLEIGLDDHGVAHLSVSIGVACLRVTPEHFESDLIDLADRAMLIAKQRGRDQAYLI